MPYSPNPSFEICLIAPSQELAATAADVLADIGEENLAIFIATADEVDSVVGPLAERGANPLVFISRKGTKSYIENSYNVKVVGIESTLSDYVTILQQAKEAGGPVAFFTHDAIPADIQAICDMLGITLRPYYYKMNKDCEQCVKQAIADGMAVGIGGSVTAAFALQYNFRHITVENSRESILIAVKTAKQLLDIQKEERAKQLELKTQLEKYMAILAFSHNAIVVIDRDGTISSINHAAEKLAGRPASEMTGLPISIPGLHTVMMETLKTGKSSLGQVINLGRAVVFANVIPIIVDSSVQAVIATFQDIKTIQDNEKKIRVKLSEKGLVAKYTFADIQGQSQLLHDTIHIAQSYAGEEAAVLIRGESGTGKELFAQSIHNASRRKNGPFVAVNCAALAKNLLDSELFGYEEGAFTGALKGGKAGLFEMAHGGTIFLDELGEIPVETQVNLLRVLQEKEVRRIGGSGVIHIDVRVIAATNRNIEDDVKQKKFREDLFFRLNVLSLHIPPLRERREDILYLSTLFLQEFSGKDYANYAPRLNAVMQRLVDYKWYGNTRELQNFVERVHILLKNSSDSIDDAMLVRGLLFDTPPEHTPFTHARDCSERAQITAALEANNYTIHKAADQLGISRQTLWRKMKKFALCV